MEVGRIEGRGDTEGVLGVRDGLWVMGWGIWGWGNGWSWKVRFVCAGRTAMGGVCEIEMCSSG